MFLLASRLGLRRFDVVNMKLSNIDWDRNEISLVQQKTQNGIVLPLIAEVGEALVDYLTNGRPKSTSSFVFLSETKRDRPVTEHTFTTLVSDCMRNAGIDIRERHHGPHSLRHSLATHLMKKKIKMPVIKEVLGHSTIEPTYAYLAVDHESLMLCSMDVTMVKNGFYSQKGGMV
jgi:site-specific recombinase XerD